MTLRTPGTPASKIDRTPATTPGGPKAKEEKIVVTVRLRPLNKKEQLAKDQIAWDCVDDHTIVFKPPPQERAAQPASLIFDKVFGPSITEAVYEDGVKNVALSALMGINATIFAYGQTSSGKTYTMRGITNKAVNDIYKHIMKKGIVVEKLVEETASNDQHLRHLIGICEGWREGNIEFAPTYKYSSANCNRYTAGLPGRSGEKQRTPAWCDRILWYGKGVRQLSYFRSESKFSDHRPVSALFSIPIEVMKVTNPRKVFPTGTFLPMPSGKLEPIDSKGGARSTLLSLISKESVKGLGSLS